MDDYIVLGKWNNGSAIVKINEKIVKCHPKYCNHGNGFSWGYNGSGPAQLAFEILFDFFKKHWTMSIDDAAKYAWDYHQDFKNKIIAKYKQNRDFALDGSEIAIFLSYAKK